MNDTPYIRNGKVVSRKEFLATAKREPRSRKRGRNRNVPMVNQAYSDSCPLVNDGVGCMKAQVAEMRNAIKARGIVGARVLDSGAVEFTSRRARKEVLAMRGLVDNEGGYGDG
jgi:hypothetical protein